MKDQQFGVWIRASQYNPTKKATVRVQGFEVLNQNYVAKEMSSHGGCLDSSHLQSGSVEECMMEFEKSGPDVAVTTTRVVSGNTFANQSLPEFEELIQEIDKSINGNHKNLNSKTESYLPTMTKERNLVPFENWNNGENSKESDMVVLDVDSHYPVPYSNSHNLTIKEIKFSMGCRVGNVEAIGTGGKKGKPTLATANMKRPKNVNRSESTIKPMILDNERTLGRLRWV